MPRGRRPAVPLADHCNANGGEGEAGGGARYQPDPPDGMSAAALAKWHQLVPMIARVCPLKDLDADSLRQYVEAAVRRAKAVAEQEGEPLTVTTGNGGTQVHPLQKVIGQCESLMNKLAERFGLDPASRKRLQIVSKGKGSKLSEFIAGGNPRQPAPTVAE